MKYLPSEGMKEALLRNAIQPWLLLEEKLAAKPTDEVARWAHLHFIRFVSAAEYVDIFFFRRRYAIYQCSFHPPRHLIRALRAHLPLKGKACVAGTLPQSIYSSRRFNAYRKAPQKQLRRATSRYNITPGGINGFNRVKDSGSGSKVYKRYLQPPGDGRFCPITTV